MKSEASIDIYYNSAFFEIIIIIWGFRLFITFPSLLKVFCSSLIFYHSIFFTFLIIIILFFSSSLFESSINNYVSLSDSMNKSIFFISFWCWKRKRLSFLWLKMIRRPSSVHFWAYTEVWRQHSIVEQMNTNVVELV